MPSPTDFDPADQRNDAQFQRWLTANHVDIFVRLRNEHPVLVCSEMCTAALQAEYFDHLSIEKLDPQGFRQSASMPAGLRNECDPQGPWPHEDTFVFETRGEVIGLLQITGTTSDPPGLKIRYKLVQPVPAWAPHNLLKNSGVEAGDRTPDDWQQGPPVQGVAYSWCKTAAFQGKASLCIEKTAQSDSPVAQWSQTVDRPANLRSMYVSALVKAENMTKGKVMVDVSFLDASGKLISHQGTSFVGSGQPQPPITTTHDWMSYSGRVEIPPQAKKLSIGLQLLGPGKVWFDNIYAGAAATSDPAAEQRFQHLLAGYRKQQDRLLTGVFRAQGVKAVEDEQSPQRTYQGPVHIFGAFDYKNGKVRFDWEELPGLRQWHPPLRASSQWRPQHEVLQDRSLQRAL